MTNSSSDEQRMLRESVRQFTSKSYSYERRSALLTDRKALDALWGEMVHLGWTAIGMPEETGGIGTMRELAIIQEEFGRCLFVGPFLSSVVLGGQVLALCGDTGRQILADVMEGRLLVAVAYSEETSRGATGPIETRAWRDGDNFAISGRKTLVLGGNNASKLIVSALVTGSGGRETIALFAVDRDAEGVEVVNTRLLDGNDAADVILSSVRVEPQALLTDDGARTLQHALDIAILASCAEVVGLMSRATEYCVEYVQIRQQFGHALSDFQAIQHRLADMVIETEVVKAALSAALSSIDSQDNHLRRKAIASAKVTSGKLGRWVCGQAIQLHGGIGMATEHIVGHFFRRVNVIEACFGNGISHLSVLKRLVHQEVSNLSTKVNTEKSACSLT